MATRLHAHLPAPAPHAAFSMPQTKSHVLAGVQDAYWSDDEADDEECPLCLEEMDISDLNFKPCVCGYQICRFCWNHIKQNLNGRCPACRREYTEDGVQFKPISKEDHKRLTQQKKQRERERKELDALNRRHLANLRVVQRNVVYVVGIGPRFAKEELIPTLRSNEFFGQYGKISNVFIVKRTPPGGKGPVVGLYITYNRREDAARAIAAVDGAPSPGGGNEVMRASYGTTKYCIAFLRGRSCNDRNCMNLHEWSDEKDCFTKEDLTTLKHTMKDTETRSRTILGKKAGDADEQGGLPRGAAWANKGRAPANQLRAIVDDFPITTRPARRAAQRQRGAVASNTAAKPQEERRGTTSAKTPSHASISRPGTPVNAGLPPRPATPVELKQPRRPEKDIQVSARPQSPASSFTADSEPASAAQESPVAPPEPEVRPESAASGRSSIPSVPSDPILPPGLPSAPPGLGAPPGLALPRPKDTASPILSSRGSQNYQMSTQAQALLDDVRLRRKSLRSGTGLAPFPDFDRVLSVLTGGDGERGAFSFSWDSSVSRKEINDNVMELPGLTDIASNGPLDSFSGLLSSLPLDGREPAGPPGIAKPSTGYSGSFDPFAEINDSSLSTSSPPQMDDDPTPKVSRFDFARGRQASTGTGVPSPLHTASPMMATPSLHHASPISRTNSMAQSYMSPDPTYGPNSHQWQHARQDFGMRPPSSASSPLAVQAQPAVAPGSRFQPFADQMSSALSEAQLRDFIVRSQSRAASQSSFGMESIHQSVPYRTGGPPFNDPAIMSASFSGAQALSDSRFPGPPGLDPFPQPGQSFAPPPGLSFPQLSNGSLNTANLGLGSGPSSSIEPSQTSGSAHGEGVHRAEPCFAMSTSASPVSPSPPPLSSADFPALTADSPKEVATPEDTTIIDTTAQDKAARKAAKKAAAIERAAARAQAAQEKAAARAAEKAKLAAEKAAEKERAAALKLEKEKERLEKERLRAEKEKADKERALQLKAERAAKDKTERQRLEQERAAREKAALAAREARKAVQAEKASKQAGGPDARPATKAHKEVPTSPITPEAPMQGPLLSRMPKKNKPATKPIRIPKEGDIIHDTTSTLPSAASDAPQVPSRPSSLAETHGRSQSTEPPFPTGPLSIAALLEQIDERQPWMNISKHPFFDLSKINPAAKMPLEYGPLVHALSALSVGGGSFANNMPSGSIDNAVSSFQQLLETLTQTISDLLRLLPRTTWDDSSSFDGVLRDMLKGDDFLDDNGEDGSAKEDEVAALTLALERRARWMEVQLSKLEELHRDINTAAVRAVLSFNDKGWDKYGFAPRVGNTLRRFDNLGYVGTGSGDEMRLMTIQELEEKLVVAKEAAVFAEAEVREAMEKMQRLKPSEWDY
ncbi:hypothetical protein PUNSTDRAFT_121179 [Punctularia strigosozonata HHB-11173 SS5]|uniref:uncharacterized protein n=1 Tax=Punctularia strigosozonata (strain HHB-11173) TaxID=741275 RepID=UPI000441750B|nr:uncharacterized protein PUNSTDRAFT_121179 [Punctularia strigosozonata HHB-11173 SS5]EIN08039.1 hypothetical protein PUNSTDRAFT_121179 [Punctularia strigosozonata HHB-11173 SS5]